MHNDLPRFPLFAGAVLAALGVALGAFGVHGLRSLLDDAALAWWQTAVQYQMWHAIGLVALGAAGVAAGDPAIERLTQDPSPLVADAARWALDQVRREPP